MSPLLWLAFPALWLYNAHNCYPEKGQYWDRLERARRAGLRAVEIDLTWSPERRRTVISHDKTPSGGEPTLEEYFWKPVEAELRRLPRGRPGWLLLIDFKVDHPGVVEEVYRGLERRQRLLTRFGEKVDYGPLTVLLTGDNAAIAAFEKRNRGHGSYLAMGNREPAGREYEDNVAAYFPAEATPFYRVFNFEWAHIEPSPGARRTEPLSEAALARLGKLAELAHQKGYWLRTWTLNASTFGGREGLRERWQAAREAGVEMIATDEYELAGSQGTQAPSLGQGDPHVDQPQAAHRPAQVAAGKHHRPPRGQGKEVVAVPEVGPGEQEQDQAHFQAEDDKQHRLDAPPQPGRNGAGTGHAGNSSRFSAGRSSG